MNYDDRYLEYIELFNDRQFYDCHEVLEDLWLEDKSHPARRFYQALIHLATAYQHLFRGNMPGSSQRFSSTLDYLDDYPNCYEGLNVGAIRENVRMWQQRISSTDGHDLYYADSDVPLLKLLHPLH